MCLGRSTRLADWISGGDKVYYAELRLGVTTSTDDLEGEVLTERPVPSLTRDGVRGVLATFVGEITQRPPIYSAIKLGGQAAYRRARRGETVEVPERQVEIHRIDLVALDERSLTIVVNCGKGTYIRSLARDVGENLGCGAVLQRLVRLRVGGFSIGDSVSLDDLAALAETPDLGGALLPVDTALLHLPSMVLDQPRSSAAALGQPWEAHRPSEGWVRAYDSVGDLLGLVRLDASDESAVSPPPRPWRLRRLLVDG